MASKIVEREVYREVTPFGDDVWVEFRHAELPEGWAVQRATTHRLKCVRCGRYTVYGFLDDSWQKQIAQHDAECEGAP